MASFALAAPTPSKKLSKRSFSVPIKPRVGVTRTPANEMARTYGKFGWEIIVSDPENPFDSTPGVTSSATTLATSTTASIEGSDAAAATTVTTTPAATTTAASSSGSESGEVTATPEADESEYLESTSIGGQTLNLDFDTGSADLWVFSSSLSSSESSGHTIFDPTKSSSWSTYQDGTWEISYGDGSSASGTVGFDKVNIGGATVTRQAIEIATSVSGSFIEDTNNDGLVGLGFSNINTIQPQAQKTFFENIMDSLALPLFTANLEESSGGSYTFGAIDESEYSGTIHYTDVDKSDGFWQFSSETYTIGGTQSQCSTCSPAIADTGTSLLLLDEDVVEAYYSQVSSAEYNSQQGGYVYDCSATLPSFGVAIGSGYTATLNGSDISFAQIDSETCFGGIQGNSGQGLQIVGDMLLKHFFAVFDGGNESFGIAEKA
ncbi:hypothetical protein LTR36_003866 [Oleoguttula mirabilis]|uniref:Peptidase A1 domain-containing protein n=1 Tax=Oleoguttula mirabilis TaxID=1507867 RepID=A0AAV9JIK2_9PEZI|nr:hypothetical protein LTR36_003866 [Oleoguttula mirabilis]